MRQREYDGWLLLREMKDTVPEMLPHLTAPTRVSFSQDVTELHKAVQTFAQTGARQLYTAIMTDPSVQKGRAYFLRMPEKLQLAEGGFMYVAEVIVRIEDTGITITVSYDSIDLMLRIEKKIADVALSVIYLNGNLRHASCALLNLSDSLMKEGVNYMQVVGQLDILQNISILPN